MKWTLCSNELDRQFVIVDENNMAIAYPATVKSQQSAHWANKKIRPKDLWNSVASPEEQKRAQLIEAAPELFQQLQKAHRFLRKSDYDMTEIDAVLNHIIWSPK